MNRQTPVKSITIPYIRGVSEGIRRVLSDLEVRVAFRPHSSLQRHLTKVKDTLPAEKKANVVYKIPCSTCSSVYVGQTGRLLGKRISEHRADVKYAKLEASAVAEHVWKKDHQMDFNAVSVLGQEKNRVRRCLLESWYIQSNQTINRENGSLPPEYVCLS